jgi:hypothetical protein
VFDGVSESTEIDGLREVLRESSLKRLLSIGVGGVAAYGHDRNARARGELSQASRYLESIQPRQPDVENHHVRRLFGRKAEGIQPVESNPSRVPKLLEEHFEHLGGVSVVVDDQNVARGRCGQQARGFRDDSRGRCRGGTWKPDDEATPSTRSVAVGDDLPAVRLYQAVGEREAYPETAVLTVDFLGALAEKLEEARHQVGSDPDAVVFDRHDDLLSLGSRDDANVTPRRRVLGRIRQEVREYLRRSRRIARPVAATSSSRW